MVLGTAAPVASQSLVAAMSGAAVEHRVEAGTGVEVSRGPLVGATVGVALRPQLEIAVTAEVGKLNPDGPGEERDVGQLGLAARLHLGSWFTAEVAARARSFTAPIARQHWTTVYVGGAARVPFAGGRWSGQIQGGVFPVVSVDGLSGARLAVFAAAGVAYRADPLTFSVQYWAERFDFRPANGTARLEQLTGLRAAVALRLRRT